jgi:hypothetical protein
MDLRLQICRDQGGPWSVKGLPRQSVAEFEELSQCLEYAKRECAAAPAMIELFTDGLYVAAFQERGWPRPLCRPGGVPRAKFGTTANPVRASKFAQIGDRLRRCADCFDIRRWLPFQQKSGPTPRTPGLVARTGSISHASQMLRR